MTLKNSGYLRSIGYSKQQGEEEIAGLWAKRLQLEKYDEIIDGKRRRKLHSFFDDFKIKLD